MDGIFGPAVFPEIILFSSIIIVFLAYSFLTKAKEVTELSKEMQQMHSNTFTPEDYLNREISKTIAIIEQAKSSANIKKYNIEALSLRLSLLNTEHSNLVEGGLSLSDTKNINRSLLKEIDLLFYKKSVNANNDLLISNAQEALSTAVHSLEKKLAIQYMIIKKLRAKLVKFDGLPAIDLAPLEGTTIKPLKNALAAAQDAYFEIEHMKRNDGKINNEKLKDAVDGLKEKYNFSLKQIDKLCDSNAHKRKLIYKLENEVGKIKGEGKDSGQALELIEKLKRQLQDSELCTQTLESEMKYLHEKIKSIYLSDPRGSKDSSKMDDIDDLSKHLMSAITSIAQATTIDDVGKILLAAAANVGLSVSLKINNNAYFYKDELTPGQKDMLSECPVSEGWIDLPQGAAFNADGVTAIVGDQKIEAIEFDIDRLSKVFMVAASGIKRIRLQEVFDRQKNLLETITKKAKESIRLLEQQNKFISDEGEKISTEFISSLDDFVENVNLSEIQREIFEDLENEFLGRLDLLLLTGTTMDGAFVELINLLDSRL